MENFSFENLNKSRKENILKSFDSNIYDAPLSDIDQEISKAIELDVIEKGRKGATIGEIRTWNGKKYQKTAQGWKPYKGKGDGAESLKDGDVDVTGQKDTPIPKEKEEVKDLLSDVKSVIKDSKTADEAFDKIKTMKNIHPDVSKEFHEKYSDNGKLSPKQAVQKLFDEVHGDKKEDLEEKYKGKTKSGKEYDLRHNIQHEKHKDHYDDFSSQDHKELADAHKKLAEDPNQTNKTFHQVSAKHHSDKAKEDKKNIDIEKIKKEYDELTDENDHGGATKLLVDAFGTDEEKEKIKNINEAHDKRGHITESDLKERVDLAKKYYNRISPSKKEESKVIGQTQSGKKIYDKFDHPEHKDFTKTDHEDAGLTHNTHTGNKSEENKHFKAADKKEDKPKDIKKQHKDLTDKKDYVGASKLLVDTYGTDDEKKKINDFIEADKKGETTEAGYKEFDSIVQKYNKEVEKKPRKPRTKKADMLIKEGNVKTQYPDIDFDKLPKEVADDFTEKIQDASSTMDDFMEVVSGTDSLGRKREPRSYDPELTDEQTKALKELDKKDLKGIDQIKEFHKIVGDNYSWDGDRDAINNALSTHKEIKEKYPDASTTKDKDQLRLFKSLNEAKKDHISKSILGY